MGAHPYWYFVEYDENINQALQILRKREFEAGRYNPVIRFLKFPLTADSPHPGAMHRSIEEAIDSAADEGTRSILDIHSVGEKVDYGVTSPFPKDALQVIYKTLYPTHEMIESNLEFLDQINRGQCFYFIIYKEGKPDELIFAGYSYD